MQLSSLLYGLGRLTARRAWTTVAVWVAVLAVAGVGAVVVGSGVSNVYAIPSTESQAAQDRLDQLFPQTSGGSAQVVAVADGADVTEEPARSAVEAIVEELSGIDQVAAAQSPFDEDGDGDGGAARDSASVSDSGQAAIVRVQFDVPGPQVSDATLDQLTRVAAEATTGDVAFSVGGGAFSQRSVGITATDLAGVVVALLVLGLVFRSVLAAGVPVVVALVGVGTGMGVVLVTTRWLDVVPSAPLLALMLGIAVGIDYALFILARHRDQLAEGLDVAESAGRAVATAGSAVVFAGITNVIALAALGLAGIPFLTVMGVSASIAVATAVAAALTLLPAVLGVLGMRLRPRADRPSRPGRGGAPGGGGLARRWVAAVTKVPLLTVVVLTVGLGVATIPAADLRLALPDNGSEEVGSPARDTYDLVSEEFGPGYSSRLLVVADVVASPDPLGAVEGVADDLAARDGVVAVTLATVNPTADTLLVQVVPTEGPSADSTAALVDEIRALAGQIEDDHGVADLAVTGTTAVGIDVSTRLEQVLLPYGIIVVTLSLGLLAIVFRSVAVPIKTGVGYLLSVGTAIGAIVAVYQWGWLAGPLQTVYVGPIVSFLPIILMGVLFGLAMDYELFLVSRMREAYVADGDARAAVRTGFVQTSRIVATLAVIMVSVFVAFVPAGDSILQPIALGLAVGVAVDAFLVRMTLVPAVMALLGRWAWWLPGWLDRALPQLDVEGEGMTRLTRLRDWPAPAAPPGVYAEGLALRGRRGRVVDRVDVAVGPGEALQVTGGSALARSALLLALAGRLAPSEGTLKVAGRLLPEETGAVRTRVALVRAGDGVDPVAAVRERVGQHTAVLVVAGLDGTVPADRRRALLAEAERRRRDEGLAVVVGGTVEAFEAAPLTWVPAHRLDLDRQGRARPEGPDRPVARLERNGGAADPPPGRRPRATPETEGVR